MKTTSVLQRLTINDLVACAKGGNSAAADYLVERYSRLLNKVIGDRSAPGHEREDLMQYARLGLWEAVQLYVPGALPFQTFAYIIAKRRVYDAIKMSNSGKHSLLNSAHSHAVSMSGDASWEWEEKDVANSSSWDLDPAQQIVANISLRRVLLALNGCLSSFEWGVLQCIWAGLSYEETAKTLNVNRKAVDNGLFRIRGGPKAEKVRRCFYDAGYEDLGLP